jgi:hypothetical protein
MLVFKYGRRNIGPRVPRGTVVDDRGLSRQPRPSFGIATS